MTQRSPRKLDLGFLTFLRQKPCCICGKPPPSEACHVRYGSPEHNKPQTGMQTKPDDKWALPMCPDHHRMQHRVRERFFWEEMLGYDALQMAILYYAEFGGTGGRARKPRRIKPRKARGKRTPIRQPSKARGGVWPKGRKIVARKTQKRTPK